MAVGTAGLTHVCAHGRESAEHAPETVVACRGRAGAARIVFVKGRAATAEVDVQFRVLGPLDVIEGGTGTALRLG